MHAGFTALRSHCPMNLRVSYTDCQPPEAVLADLARLETLWSWARDTTGSTTPWLCGDYSAADAFFAPVATRIATYNLPVSARAMAYVNAHLSTPASAVGAPWARSTAPIRTPTAATISAATGRARPAARPRGHRDHGRERRLPLLRQTPYQYAGTERPPLRLLQRLLPRQDRGRPRGLAEVHGPLPIVNHSALPVNQCKRGQGDMDRTQHQHGQAPRHAACTPNPPHSLPLCPNILAEGTPEPVARLRAGAMKVARGTRSIPRSPSNT